jgi:polysaccharide export outer membrane protein
MGNSFRKQSEARKMEANPLLLALVYLWVCATLGAQQPVTTKPPANATSESAKTDSRSATDATASRSLAASQDGHYRIGPGDVLDIRILNRPNLSRESVRVEGSGAIRMPLIDSEIQAACLTEGELAKEIAKRYLRFYRNPQVDVFIKDYRSTQVAIIGMVTEQGRFQLQRRIRLLELLTYARGPGERAGQTINVVHSGTAFQCEKEEPGREDVVAGISSFKLSDTLLGLDNANPYLNNGDIVTLPEADQVYVVGNVVLPRSIPLKEPITLTRAIAMSGGLGKDTKSSRIRIVRQEPGSATKKEIYVDLTAIEKKRAEDIALVANDIVDVPISGARSLLRSMVGGLAPAVSQLPVRVVP